MFPEQIEQFPEVLPEISPQTSVPRNRGVSDLGTNRVVYQDDVPSRALTLPVLVRKVCGLVAGLRGIHLTVSVYEVVLQELILAQICQLVLYIGNNEG